MAAAAGMENLMHVYSQFKTSLHIFDQKQAVLGGDSTAAKDMSDHVMFLSHATPSHPNELARFPGELARFLESSAPNLPWELRFNATQSLISLINKKIIDMSETLAHCKCTVLELFMELQTLQGNNALNEPELKTLGQRALKKQLELQTQGNKALKKLAFNHVIQSIKKISGSSPKIREFQKILFRMLTKEVEEKKAKRALITLQDLYRKKIWDDERTANAICVACFHSSPSIMKTALAFLLYCDKIEDDGFDSDDDQQPQVMLNALYKASHNGTTSSKKLARMKRAARNYTKKKEQRLSSQNSGNTRYYSPLNHLKDPQVFAEKLLQSSINHSFEDNKMMMLKVIARTIGLHQLILLNFYQYIQEYVQPTQTDVITMLAAAVEACHETVPPDAVKPLFKQIVNQFVHDQSPAEDIRVGLNAVREIRRRMPLLMSEDLLQDLGLHGNSHENSVSSATRSLLSLFSDDQLVEEEGGKKSIGNKRKLSDFDHKKCHGSFKKRKNASNKNDSIFYNEAFNRSFRELEAKHADPAAVEANMKVKLSRKEKFVLIKEKRERRKGGKHSCMKRNKNGGKSNKQMSKKGNASWGKKSSR